MRLKIRITSEIQSQTSISGWWLHKSKEKRKLIRQFALFRTAQNGWIFRQRQITNDYDAVCGAQHNGSSIGDCKLAALSICLLAPIKLKRSRLRPALNWRFWPSMAWMQSKHSSIAVALACFRCSKLATMHNLQAGTLRINQQMQEIIGTCYLTAKFYSRSSTFPAILPSWVFDFILHYFISPPLTKQFGGVFVIHSFR